MVETIDFDQLIKLDQEIRLSRPNRKPEKLTETIDFLGDSLKIWQDSLNDFKRLVPQIDMQSLLDRTPTPVMIELGTARTIPEILTISPGHMIDKLPVMPELSSGQNFRMIPPNSMNSRSNWLISL